MPRELKSAFYPGALGLLTRDAHPSFVQHGYRLVERLFRDLALGSEDNEVINVADTSYPWLAIQLRIEVIQEEVSEKWRKRISLGNADILYRECICMFSKLRHVFQFHRIARLNNSRNSESFTASETMEVTSDFGMHVKNFEMSERIMNLAPPSIPSRTA